jgi:hypothetical protein
MPKVEIDYSNTIIYKITCRDPSVKDVYVGHTTNFVQRKHTHKQTCNDVKNTTPCKLYQVIRENGGWNNWKMEIVSFFECKDHYEARKKEQEYFVLLNATLNSIEPMPKPKLVIPVEKVKIQKQTYYCEICNIKFQNSNLFDIHKKTKKHIKKQQLTTESTEIMPFCDLTKKPKLVCEFCNFTTCKQSNYNIHITTRKHIDALKINEKSTENAAIMPHHNKSQYTCKNCNKMYNERSGLWRHKKKCNFSEENAKNTEDNISLSTDEIEEKPEEEGPMNTTMIFELLKQNNEFKELIIEQNKKILELVNTNNTITNNNITNNTTNNKFNLNIFLNEKCKDAFNITDFINSIDVGFKDFENFGRLGYVNNISNIFIRELKGLDVYKRPIHCSDLKREVIHVKDNNTWVKDEEKKQMKRAIKLIEHKNIKLIPDWVKANPDAEDYSSKKHDEYNKMLDNAMGEMEDEDNERNYERIIKNVAKEILIDKEKDK